MDEFFSNKEAPRHQTVIDEKIQFNQPDNEDPDWVVEQRCLLVVAAATEPVISVDNLWKCGEGRGRHPHPNFGQCIPINVFKCFKAACAFMWCDKKWWCEAKRDRHWDIFLPCLESFNNKRKALFLCQLLMLDKSMSGHRPKTSKAGGFPYISCEPRKPVPLGAMFRNGVECLSGIMVCQEAMMASEHQQQKKCWLDPDDNNKRLASAMPNNLPMSASAAEVLRQVEGAALDKGGWVGGDACFGSVQSCVELKTRFEVFSAFIVKHNKSFFPNGNSARSIDSTTWRKTGWRLGGCDGGCQLGQGHRHSSCLVSERGKLLHFHVWKDSTFATVSYTHLTLPTNREV